MRIISASIDVNKIDKSKLVKGEKGTYLNLNIIVSDEKDTYCNDTSIAIGQSKEEREAKVKKVFLGNGKTVWTGEGKKNDPINNSVSNKNDGDLPF